MVYAWTVFQRLSASESQFLVQPVAATQSITLWCHGGNRLRGLRRMVCFLLNPATQREPSSTGTRLSVSSIFFFFKLLFSGLSYPSIWSTLLLSLTFHNRDILLADDRADTLNEQNYYQCTLTAHCSTFNSHLLLFPILWIRVSGKEYPFFCKTVHFFLFR